VPKSMSLSRTVCCGDSSRGTASQSSNEITEAEFRKLRCIILFPLSKSTRYWRTGPCFDSGLHRNQFPPNEDVLLGRPGDLIDISFCRDVRITRSAAGRANRGAGFETKCE